jgi:hypothetical protein
MSTQIIERPPGPGGRRRGPALLAVLLAVIAVVAASVTTALVVRSNDRNTGNTTPSAAPPASAPTAPSQAPAQTAPSQAPAQTAPSQAPAQTAPSPSSGASTPASPSTSTPAVPVFPFQPLWPFTSVSEAVAWQEEANPGGHQPWKLDPGETALSFAHYYLGYTEVNKVVGKSVIGRHAWVKVGYNDPNGRPRTVANLHLAKIGTGQWAPWEVVGSRDTRLTLTIPAYGATVRSPLTVSGRITGVDESLVIQVHEQRREGPIGQTAGIPAGGVNTPWRATVSFSAPAGTVLTVAVSTGGHLAAVEAFAITGVRVGG